MDFVDHPRWQDGPKPFRILIARLLLVSLALSWGDADAHADGGEAGPDALKQDVPVQQLSDPAHSGRPGVKEKAATPRATIGAIEREASPL
jgi:hypothetical protein